VTKALVVPVIRELVRCYQAFERASSAHIRQSGLTPPQFDVIATLGNTTGLSCKELGERTLMTKGTLTGVLDRLEERGLLTRLPSSRDGRSFLVRLTRTGDATFRRTFEPHLEFLAPAFEALSDTARHDLERRLAQLRGELEKRHHALAPGPATP